jgi:hypothetical protein
LRDERGRINPQGRNGTPETPTKNRENSHQGGGRGGYSHQTRLPEELVRQAKAIARKVKSGLVEKGNGK